MAHIHNMGSVFSQFDGRASGIVGRNDRNGIFCNYPTVSVLQMEPTRILVDGDVTRLRGFTAVSSPVLRRLAADWNLSRRDRIALLVSSILCALYLAWSVWSLRSADQLDRFLQLPAVVSIFVVSFASFVNGLHIGSAHVRVFLRISTFVFSTAALSFLILYWITAYVRT